MKKFKDYINFFSIVFALVISSCEKVVTIDVKSADNRVVVQGNVSSQPGPYTVKLNYTIKYYDSNSFPVVKGALVKISDDAGNNETLSETSPGIYKTSTLLGTPGRIYNLEVTANGKTYTASDKMPNSTQLDSFIVAPIIGRNSLVTNGYRVTCKFTDPLGLGNYYKVTISSNDTILLGDRTTRILSDKLADGGQLAVTFRTSLLMNDTVHISLQSITKSTYDFYNTLTNAEGEVGASQFLSSLPANPTNNIKPAGEGLGYFSVCAEVKQTKIIQ